MVGLFFYDKDAQTTRDLLRHDQTADQDEISEGREIYLTELGGHHFLNWTKGDFVSFVDQKMAEMARVEVFLCDWDVNLRKKRAKGS